jgi:hypothetical protein
VNLLDKLENLKHLVWLQDIEHPTCPEYIELHEKMQKIMGAIDQIIEDLGHSTDTSPGRPNSRDQELSNKIIRTTHEFRSYVIVVRKNGVLKYIEKDSFHSPERLTCTVKPNLAKRFYNYEDALRFWNRIKNSDWVNAELEGIVPIDILYYVDLSNLEV